MGNKDHWKKKETLIEPDFAIREANPTVFKQIVLPPVLGPVITKTRVFWAIKKSTGTGWACSSAVTWQLEPI